MSGFLVEPVRDNENFKKIVSNIIITKSGKKGDFLRRGQSLQTFFLRGRGD